MATASLDAKARSDTGKGVARKIRQRGEVPGVIYGHGRSPQPLVINTRELQRLLDTVAVASTVIELSVDGSTARTLVREIQRHPFKRHILHIDFQELVAGEKVTVRVPLVFVGSAEGVRAGGILEEVMHDVELRLDPANIPNHIDVDVSALTIGHGIHVSDLKVPEGVEILAEPAATVCTVTPPRAVVEEVAATPEAEVPAEPELIRKPKGEEEEEEK